MKTRALSRRDFLSRSAATAGTLAALNAAVGETGPQAGDKPARAGANEKIVVGMMGTGGRGRWLINEELCKRSDVEIAWVCDCDQNRVNAAAKEVEKGTGRKPRIETDFRRMLEDKSIDAIFNCTPDHWHALGTIKACQAGKDVFVEKPASHTPWEGRKMVEAARKYGRVVQLGTQTRSGAYTMEARKFLDEGKIGKVHMVRVRNLKLLDPVPVREDGDPPPGIDYDMWVGPAPMKPFNASRFHYNWHWIWDYSGGDIINDGIHQIDAARYLIGKEYPKSVWATGGMLARKDATETPDTQVVTWDFGDLVMYFELALWTPHMQKMAWLKRDTMEFPNWQFNAMTVEVQGTNGMMYFERHGGGWQAWGAEDKMLGDGNGPHPHTAHVDNFFECIRTRGTPTADIEEGHRSTLLAQMGNISYRLGGRKLNFDAKTESFIDDSEANAYLKREYRAPWIIPETV